MKPVFIILICVATLRGAGDPRVIDLRGQWKFRIGDNMQWANPDFDDAAWEKIFVPSAWEDEGFNGYDGFAWYRTTFSTPSGENCENLYLYLGYIDDVDEVYLNGHFIGFSGAMPPNYFTAYNIERRYRIPPEYLHTNRPNQLAVRVYDKELGGGILRGKVGIYKDTQTIVPELNLSGEWKFKTGDNSSYSEPDYPDDNWKSIYVPAPWEIEGYKDYDGIGWYRKYFTLPRSMEGDRLILLLGQIDDLDETFINGSWVGGTGNIDTWDQRLSDEWQKYRVYELDPDILNFNGQNLLAVRVYDKYVQGGIYRGPIGIVRYHKYRDWVDRHSKKTKTLLDKLFNF